MRRPLALRQKRAVQRAYRRHARDVYRYALAVLGDHGDAEAVVRRTFLKAHFRRQRRKRARLHLNALLGIAHDVCRRRAGEGDPFDLAGTEPHFGALACRHAERALSRELDGYLRPHDLRFLRSHLGVCSECDQFRRALRRQRAAFRALAALPVPDTLPPFSGFEWRRLDAAAVRKFQPARASP